MLEKLLKLILGENIGGRMFLTICCGVVFVFLNVSGKLDAKDAMSVIVMVFTLYFTRTDRTPPTNGGTK